MYQQSIRVFIVPGAGEANRPLTGTACKRLSMSPANRHTQVRDRLVLHWTLLTALNLPLLHTETYQSFSLADDIPTYGLER